MRLENLPYTGPLSNGIQLREQASRAITSVEIQAARTPGGRTNAALLLQQFFTGCANSLTAFVDAVLPTVTTRVRTAANTAVITFSKPLEAGTNMDLTAFVFTPARPVTAIVVAGSTVTITATGTIVGDSVAYTAPTGYAIADAAGNRAANFSGVLA